VIKPLFYYDVLILYENEIEMIYFSFVLNNHFRVLLWFLW